MVNMIKEAFLQRVLVFPDSMASPMCSIEKTGKLTLSPFVMTSSKPRKKCPSLATLRQALLMTILYYHWEEVLSIGPCAEIP